MAKPKLLSYKLKRTPMQNAALAFLAMVFGLATFGALPTQWFAAKYDYDVNLGPGLWRIGRVALYWPVQWIEWGWRLGDVEAIRDDVHTMMFLGASSVILAIFFAVFVANRLGRYGGGMEALHGSAHWAEVHEVNNTGFMSTKDFKAQGVVVGSVMFDRKGQIIHPHHPLYERRYKPWMIPAPGWRGYLGKRIQKRDEYGVPLYRVRKSVVKRIELLQDGKNTHIFAFCPTRSGKGRGMIIPTLTTWRHSVMVNDPKGEAYALTAGFRKAAGQEIIKFEPACTNGTGARWNPLEEIRAYTSYDVQDAQMIMMMACDPKGEGLYDYFDKAGYEFLTGLALHVRYAEANGSLQGIAQFLGDPNWDSDKQMYLHMMQAEHDPEGKMGWVDMAGKPTKTHPMIANVAKTMLNKEDKDRSGVLSTAKSLLSLYLDPIVAQNTNCSDFKVRDLMTHSKPVSLYYVVGPADMERMTPLTRLFYALFIRRNAADMEFENGRSKKNYTFPLLMIIDEMSSLQKLSILQEALGYVAGYGIRLFMLVQDIAQVEELYGEKQTVDSGAETRIVYAPNKHSTAEQIAAMTGKTTITEEKASRSVDSMGLKGGSVSVNVEKYERDLMTAGEVETLSNDDVLIFVKGNAPVYGRKAYYDENKVMLARAKMPPPPKSSVLRQATAPGDVKVRLGGNAADAAAAEAAAAEASQKEAIAEKWAASRAALAARVQAKAAEGAVAAGPAMVVASPAAGVASASSARSAAVAGAASPADGVVIAPAGTAAAARGALNQVDRGPGVPPAGTSERRAKPRSRYADAVKVLTAEEQAQVNALVADVALTERVMRISAF